MTQEELNNMFPTSYKGNAQISDLKLALSKLVREGELDGGSADPELLYFESEVNGEHHGGWCLKRVYDESGGALFSDTGNYAVDLGKKTVEENGAFGNYSFVTGYNNTTLGDYSHAEGNDTEASGEASHAEGQSTTASGNSSHAEGVSSYSFLKNSHAEGQSTKTANWDYAFEVTDYDADAGTISVDPNDINNFNPQDRLLLSFFDATTLITSVDSISSNVITLTDSFPGKSIKRDWYNYVLNITMHENNPDPSPSIIHGTSHAEGILSIASGFASHAEGTFSISYGHSSHAEGFKTYASKNGSHAEGQLTTAGGEASHAEGKYTIANEKYAHAEGQSTTASGSASHAEGKYTKANEKYAHAEGKGTGASGEASHAEGLYTKAQNDNMHAAGKYNVGTDTDTIHETGIGTDDSDRKNAFEIYTDGTLVAPEATPALVQSRGNQTLVPISYLFSAEFGQALPTTDPGVTGMLWNDAGALKVSS